METEAQPNHVLPVPVSPETIIFSCALRQAPSAAVEATPGGKVDIFDASFREAQLRGPQPVGQALIGSHRLFAIKHQREPVLMTEFIGLFG